MSAISHRAVLAPAQVDPAGIIDHTCLVTARRRHLRSVLWGLALIPAGLLVLVVADALCDLPALVRGVGAGAYVVTVLVLLSAGAWAQGRPPREQALRLAEAALQDRDRRLTVTLELSAMALPAAAAFFAPAIATSELARTLSPLRWRMPMACLTVAAALMAVTPLLLPGCLGAVLPRYLAPWGDHPPWSRVHLSWHDLPTSIRYDDTPTLHLAVAGGDPADLEIHLRADDASKSAVIAPFLIAPGVYGLTLAPVHQGLTLWASGGGTRTTYQHLALDPVPHLLDCQLTVSAPAYAHLADETQSATLASPATMQLLPGSHLQWQVHASRVLTAISWGPADAIASPGSRCLLHEGKGACDDPQVGDAFLVCEAPDGAQSPPAVIAHLIRRIDQPPTVAIELPDQDGLAVEDAQIPLHITASDDLGLVRLTRYRMVDNVQVDSQETPLGGTSDGYRGRIDLRGLHAGQVVRIGAVARDSMPGAGQLSEVAERVLTIISHADYQKQLAASMDDTALTATYGSMLQELAALEAQVAHQDPVSDAPAAKAQRESLSTRLQRLQDQIDALHAQDPLLAIEPDLQQQLTQEIAELQDELHHRLGSGSAGAPNPQQAAAIQTQLQQLSDEARALALREDLADLAQEQEDLHQQLQNLQLHAGDGSDADRARLRALGREQQEVDRDLTQWRADAAALATSCERRGGDGQALASAVRALVSAVERSDAPDQVAKAAHSAMTSHLREADSQAEAAAAALAAFLMDHGDVSEAAAKGVCPHWCLSAHCATCRSQLVGMARHGHGRAGSGLGSGMHGLQSGQDGMSHSVPVYGPRPLSTRASGRPGNAADGQGPGTDGEYESDSQLQAATPYQRGLQRTTAGIGASFTPDEQHRIQLYYDALDGIPPTPIPQEPSK